MFAQIFHILKIIFTQLFFHGQGVTLSLYFPRCYVTDRTWHKVKLGSTGDTVSVVYISPTGRVLNWKLQILQNDIPTPCALDFLRSHTHTHTRERARTHLFLNARCDRPNFFKCSHADLNRPCLYTFVKESMS